MSSWWIRFRETIDYPYKLQRRDYEDLLKRRQDYDNGKKDTIGTWEVDPYLIWWRGDIHKDIAARYRVKSYR